MFELQLPAEGTNKKGRWTSYQLNDHYEVHPEQININDLVPAEIRFKNSTDQTIYHYIRTNGFITTHQIVEITNISTLQGASVALGRLMRAGLVIKVRKGKHFIYQLEK